MLVDKVPHDLVQHRGPDFADVVNLVVRVRGHVHVRVHAGLRRVQVVSDAGRVVVDPGTETVIGVASVGVL